MNKLRKVNAQETNKSINANANKTINKCLSWNTDVLRETQLRNLLM